MDGQRSYDDKFASMTREKLRNQIEENKSLQADLRALAVAAHKTVAILGQDNDASTADWYVATGLKKALARIGIVSLLRIDEDGLPSINELRSRHDAGWLLTKRARLKAGLDVE